MFKLFGRKKTTKQQIDQKLEEFRDERQQIIQQRFTDYIENSKKLAHIYRALVINRKAKWACDQIDVKPHILTHMANGNVKKHNIELDYNTIQNLASSSYTNEQRLVLLKQALKARKNIPVLHKQRITEFEDKVIKYMKQLNLEDLVVRDLLTKVFYTGRSHYVVYTLYTGRMNRTQIESWRKAEGIRRNIKQRETRRSRAKSSVVHQNTTT